MNHLHLWPTQLSGMDLQVDHMRCQFPHQFSTNQSLIVLQSGWSRSKGDGFLARNSVFLSSGEECWKLASFEQRYYPDGVLRVDRRECSTCLRDPPLFSSIAASDWSLKAWTWNNAWHHNRNSWYTRIDGEWRSHVHQVKQVKASQTLIQKRSRPGKNLRLGMWEHWNDNTYLARSIWNNDWYQSRIEEPQKFSKSEISNITRW